MDDINSRKIILDIHSYNPYISLSIYMLLHLTDTPDMSPHPLFSQHNARGLASSMWNLQHSSWDREAYARERIEVVCPAIPAIRFKITSEDIHCYIAERNV